MGFEHITLDAGAAETAIGMCQGQASVVHDLAWELRQYTGETHADWDAGTYDIFCARIAPILSALEESAAELRGGGSAIADGLDAAEAEERRRAEEQRRREEEQRREREARAAGLPY